MSRSTLPLHEVLFSQGFGARRECQGLIAEGLVSVAGAVIDDPFAPVETASLEFTVQGRNWPYHAKALVMLHKPIGYECSMKPTHHPGVMSLLASPLRVRGLQPVGRLDADTSGLLLLTDDGALNHRLTHPKRHVTKTYEVATARPVTDEQVAALCRDLVLRDEPKPVRALAARRTGEQALSLVVDEGRYHQVRRMIAAVGNHCETLHRSAVGSLPLPADLPTGEWCFLGEAEQKLLFTAGTLD